jgi:hypothetical protein
MALDFLISGTRRRPTNASLNQIGNLLDSVSRCEVTYAGYRPRRDKQAALASS